MTHSEMIQVISAHKNGKPIQSRNCGDAAWHDSPTPGFNFESCEYRAKPELRTIFVRHYANGIMSIYSGRLEAEAAATGSLPKVFRIVEYKEVLQ